MSDRKCAASRRWCSSRRAAFEPVPGMGGQQLEGGDLVVLHRPLRPGPAHQDGRQLAFHPHRRGRHGAIAVGPQLGVPAGALEVVVRPRRCGAVPARAPPCPGPSCGYPRRRSPAAPGMHDAEAAAVVEELAHVGRLEPRARPPLRRPRPRWRPRRASPAGGRAPPPGSTGWRGARARPWPARGHELPGQLHRDEIGGAGGGEDDAEAQHQRGGTDVPARAGQREDDRPPPSTPSGRSSRGGGTDDVRHEHALQQEDEVEVGMTAAGQARCRRRSGRCRTGTTCRDRAGRPRARSAPATAAARMGMVPRMATPMRVKNGARDSG